MCRLTLLKQELQCTSRSGILSFLVIVMEGGRRTRTVISTSATVLTLEHAEIAVFTVPMEVELLVVIIFVSISFHMLCPTRSPNSIMVDHSL